MLHKIGLQCELVSLTDRLPLTLLRRLSSYLSTLEKCYGRDRDYLSVGGYILIAEEQGDLAEMKNVIDLETEPCEWVVEATKDFLCCLFLKGDDFSIVVTLPIAIAPQTLLDQLKGETK